MEGEKFLLHASVDDGGLTQMERDSLWNYEKLCKMAGSSFMIKSIAIRCPASEKRLLFKCNLNGYLVFHVWEEDIVMLLEGVCGFKDPLKRLMRGEEFEWEY